MPFTSPVAGGGGALVRPVFKSPDFLTGVRGWAIYRDGSAEFNNITARGNIQAVSLNIVNGNSRIVAASDASGGQPAVTFNPNITLYNDGYVVGTTSFTDPDVAKLIVASPYDLGAAGAKSANIVLQSGYTGVESAVSITGDSVEAVGGSLFDGRAQRITLGAQSATVTPGNSVTFLSVTFTAAANRSYEVTATWPAITVGTPVAFPGNRADVRIFRGATQIAEMPILAQNTVLGQCGGTINVPDVPGAGSVTYSAVLFHEAASTAATFRTSGSATQPSTLVVRGLGS